MKILIGPTFSCFELFPLLYQREIMLMLTFAAHPLGYIDQRNHLETCLQGDLTGPLPSVVVATHQDKAITGRFVFVITFSFCLDLWPLGGI